MGAPEVNWGQFWGISAPVGSNSSLIITTRNPDSKELMQQEFIRGKKILHAISLSNDFKNIYVRDSGSF